MVRSRTVTTVVVIICLFLPVLALGTADRDAQLVYATGEVAFVGVLALAALGRLRARTLEVVVFAIGAGLLTALYLLEIAAVDQLDAATTNALAFRATRSASLLIVAGFLLMGSVRGVVVAVGITLTYALLPVAVGAASLARLLSEPDVRVALFYGIALTALTWGLARTNVVLEDARRRTSERAELAFTDHLTGLPNRRELQAHLDALLASPYAADRPGGVVLLDLDRFKAVNDTWGHEVGDAVLRAVGRALSTTLRDGDVAGRWGGEEFCVVLPGVTPAAAERVAQRLRVAVQECRAPVMISASLGVAVRVPGDSLRTLLARADAGLYDAKAGGRDRVVMAA